MLSLKLSLYPLFDLQPPPADIAAAAASSSPTLLRAPSTTMTTTTAMTFSDLARGFYASSSAVCGGAPDGASKYASQIINSKSSCLVRHSNKKLVSCSGGGRGCGSFFVGLLCAWKHHYPTTAGGDGRHYLTARKSLVGIRLQADSHNHHDYHPSEEIGDSFPLNPGGGNDNDGQRLTDAEIARNIIEVNDKATLIFSESVDEIEDVHENILWPELPYLTDEHGGIYIEVNSEEDVLQTLASNDGLVQVLIGLDSIEKIAEVELSGQSDIHFGMEDLMSEDIDSDDDFDQDFEISDDDDFISEPFGDWANLDTMQSSHPMYFARKITEVVSNTQFDWMDLPSTGLVIQGFLRPALIEENSIVHQQNEKGGKHKLQSLTESTREEERDTNEGLHMGLVFYKVEMITIQLVSAYGNLSFVKVQDYRQAQPDVLAHSAAKIISRLKSGGEKTTQALKSLCLSQKGIQVEEVDLTGVDSLGFDLRACSGTQIQNLRFAFKTRASSEYSAERQLHDFLFPRIQSKQQDWNQAPRKES